MTVEHHRQRVQAPAGRAPFADSRPLSCVSGGTDSIHACSLEA